MSSPTGSAWQGTSGEIPARSVHILKFVVFTNRRLYDMYMPAYSGNNLRINILVKGRLPHTVMFRANRSEIRPDDYVNILQSRQ